VCGGGGGGTGGGMVSPVSRPPLERRRFRFDPTLCKVFPLERTKESGAQICLQPATVSERSEEGVLDVCLRAIDAREEVDE